MTKDKSTVAKNTPGIKPVFTVEEADALRAQLEQDPRATRIIIFIDNLRLRGASIDKAIYCAAMTYQNFMAATEGAKL